MLLPYLSRPLFLFPGLLKLTLLFFYLPLLVLITPLSILLILLDLFLRQVPQYLLEFLPSPLTLDLHFLTLPMPSQPLPPMVIPRTIPVSFSSTGPQSSFGPRPSRRSVRIPRGTPPGRRRAPRGRRSKITSTASCQTSPIPSYFWPDFQPRRASSGGPSTDGALHLALMPRAYSHFPTSLPLDPLHFDFFTILRVASPVVTFHCPSPLTQ